MRRAVQETRYRAHGHAPESAAHHRAEDQSIADISGHKSGYNIRHVHANDFDIQPFIFEKTFLQSSRPTEERTYWGSSPRYAPCRQRRDPGRVSRKSTEQLERGGAFSQPFSRLPNGFENGIHLTSPAPLRQLFLEHLTNARIFIFIFELIAACFHALGSAPLLSQSGNFTAAEGLEPQTSSRLGADVEMLVKPPFRRNQKASRSPVVALNILPLRPHD